MAERAREIEDDFTHPALQDWLEMACLGVAIEPFAEGDGWDVIVHNGLTGDDREEAVMATCEREGEAELIAVALWAQARRWTS